MALLALPSLPCPVIGRPLRALALLVCAALLAAPAAARPVQEAETPAGAAGTAGAMLIPLQCRLREGPWQDCRMKVEQVGAHWFLLLDGQTIEFRHDGRGAVTMQQQGSDWRPVSSRWMQDTSLCWDGVCAKGPIPLD